jgi:Tol biopolymer transport system component
MQPLTFEEGNLTPAFSPDGGRLAIAREVGDGNQGLWLLDVNAPGSMRCVFRFNSRFQTVLGWSPDGRGVLLRSQGTDTRQDLVFVTIGDSTHLRTVLGTRFNEPVGSISPDGHWLAYVSDESGRYECRVRPFPDTGGQVVVVSRGAYANPNAGLRKGVPIWRRDGRELLYTAADRRTILSVSVTPGNPPRFGDPQPVFRLPSAATDFIATPDLQRFVLSITREEEGRSSATILLNWPRLLESAR